MPGKSYQIHYFEKSTKEKDDGCKRGNRFP